MWGHPPVQTGRGTVWSTFWYLLGSHIYTVHCFGGGDLPPLRIELVGREGVVSDTAVHGGRRAAVRAGAYVEARARAWAVRADVATVGRTS